MPGVTCLARPISLCQCSILCPAGDDGGWTLACQKGCAGGSKAPGPEKTIHGHHELPGAPAPSPTCKNGTAEKAPVMFVTMQIAFQLEVQHTTLNDIVRYDFHADI